MENTSTEVSLAAHSEMVKERADHQPVVLFTKYNIDADKPVQVVIILRVRFIGGPTSQGKQGIVFWILGPRNISRCDHHVRDTSVGGFG